MLHSKSVKLEINYSNSIPGKDICGFGGVIEVTVYGPLVRNEGDSSQGMVLDFSILKKIMMAELHTRLDHGFAVWKDDIKTVILFGTTEGYTVSTLDFILARNTKVLILDQPPTAEVLAEWAYNRILDRLNVEILSGNVPREIALEHVVWYETPNSKAQYPK